MKVIVKNKLISIGGSSTVKDENGENVFFVKGKAFSPTHVKWILDKNKNKLFKVRNKWFNFVNERAFIYQGKTKLASIKHPFMGGKKFIVEGHKDEIKVDGNFFARNATIYKNDKPVGKISNKFLTVTDTYELEADEQDMPFMIALVVAIDNIRDKISKSTT